MRGTGIKITALIIFLCTLEYQYTQLEIMFRKFCLETFFVKIPQVLEILSSISRKRDVHTHMLHY